MTKMENIQPNKPCPCRSGKPYNACCGTLHQGLPAPNAEALMRSRYTAFVLELEDYLLKTWHPKTRPAALNLDEDTPTKWLGLQIKHTENSGANNAVVEFVARYKVASKVTRLHETSQFERIDGHWYYLSGEFKS
jgi:SEC-C motif-containing protein